MKKIVASRCKVDGNVNDAELAGNKCEYLRAELVHSVEFSTSVILCSHSCSLTVKCLHTFVEIFVAITRTYCMDMFFGLGLYVHNQNTIFSSLFRIDCWFAFKKRREATPSRFTLF